MLLFDRSPLNETKVTEDGYIAASVRASRTGIQKYTAKEVGRDGDKIYSVYRPADEVFNDKTIETYAKCALTNDHPPEMVTPENYSKYNVGKVAEDVARETLESGDFVRVSLLAMDAKVIKDIKGGKKELSMGYTCDLDFTAGVTPDGEKYDAIQRNLRMNHLAIVTKARGGSKLKIGDDKPKETDMSDHTNLVLDGVTVSIPAKDAANVQSVFDKLTAENDKLSTDLKAAKDKNKADEDEKEKMKGENLALKASAKDNELTDSRIEAFIKARDQKTVVAKLLGDEAAAEMSDKAITSAYDTLKSTGKLDGLALAAQDGGIQVHTNDAWGDIVTARGGK